MGLFQLRFADDLILLCHGDKDSVSVFKQALATFYNMSGLQVNDSKSNCFIAGLNEGEAQVLIQFVGFNEGKCPLRYLGVPLILSKLRVADCKDLVDSITGKVKAWATRTLSFAGRVLLIKSVLYSVQQ